VDDNFCQNISYTTYLRGPFDNVFDDGVDRKSTQETAIMAIYTSVLEDLCSKQRWLIHPNELENTWKNDHTRGHPLINRNPGLLEMQELDAPG